jgi:hypothetical protein
MTSEAVRSKGEGLAFTLRNASDYFKSAQYESLNRKIISLYYGALALARPKYWRHRLALPT